MVTFLGAAILEEMPNELIELIEQEAPRNSKLVQALETAVAREMTPGLDGGPSRSSAIRSCFDASSAF